MENFYDYIEKGGIIFSILLILSAVGITLITYKFIEINFFNDLDLQSFEQDLNDTSNIGDFKQLIDLKPNSDKKIFLIETLNIIEANTSKVLKDQEIQTLLQKKYIRSQKFLPSLEIIAQVSPLIGLLGTVIGMIVAFQEMARQPSVNPTDLASGIYTAMITTAAGLAVGIISYISYNYMVTKIDNIVFNLEHNCEELIQNILKK